MKMTFRGTEDILVENIQTPQSEIWYQDLKDIPSIELPERALVVAGMSLHWKMDHEDKPVYMEDVKIVSLYVVAYKRDNGNMTTIPKRADEELWYLRIVKNFALPRDEDLAAQPPTGAALRKPKAEPRDPADIPASNPDDPIDLESSPEPLLRTKETKRKQTEVEAAGQPAKKVSRTKIGKRGNLDAFITKPPPEKPIPSTRAESLPVFNDDLPPSPSRAPIREQLEGTKAAETEMEKVVEEENPEVGKPVEVELEAEKVVETETEDVNVTQPKSPEVVAREPEKGKSVHEDPVITIPTSATTSATVNVVRSPSGDQGFFAHNEEESPIRPEETLGDYYYRSYSERKASEIHTPVWKLKKGDTFSDWQVFLLARVALLRTKLEADRNKFESDQKTEEWSTAGWKRNAEAEAALLLEECKRWREICEKDNNEKIGLLNVINNLKAEIEKLKKQDAEIERLKKEKAEAEAAHDEARSHRERSEQREVHTCATLALKNKEIDGPTSLLSNQEQIKAELNSAKKDLLLERVEKPETSHRLSETEEKLENSETARMTAESLVEPFKDSMLWMKHRRIISVANSVLNSNELDQTVTHLLVTARNDGYAQGYAECT
ncbi:hypothetical protein HanPSC8_Chr04g0152791 [Helianthus annuus]|nr:hypothetical protein HanPSC8_Chr04g0152791 [Helianthus annuus]